MRAILLKCWQLLTLSISNCFNSKHNREKCLELLLIPKPSLMWCFTSERFVPFAYSCNYMLELWLGPFINLSYGTRTGEFPKKIDDHFLPSRGHAPTPCSCTQKNRKSSFCSFTWRLLQWVTDLDSDRCGSYDPMVMALVSERRDGQHLAGIWHEVYSVTMPVAWRGGTVPWRWTGICLLGLYLQDWLRG